MRGPTESYLARTTAHRRKYGGFERQPGPADPVIAGQEFLETNGDLFGIAKVIPRLHRQRVIESLGAWHVIHQQRHLGRPIHRAYVTVHLDKEQRAYLVKSRAAPIQLPREWKSKVSGQGAWRRALRAVSMAPGMAPKMAIKEVWFPARMLIHPAYKIRVHREKPRSDWIIYVHAETGRILSKYDNPARETWKARVFDPNPVTAVPDWVPVTQRGRVRKPPDGAYRTVDLGGLKGRGDRLDGARVSTSLTPHRIVSRDHQLTASSAQPGFDEAMVCYHIDQALRYLETLGYTGTRAVFSKPIPVNAHGTREDNSWYSPSLKCLTFGTGGADDAEDAAAVPRLSSLT